MGSALAKHMYEAGWEVCGFARDGDKLKALALEMPEAQITQADATDEQQVREAFAEFSSKKDSADAYVHCIGSILLKGAHATSAEEWQDTMMLNLSSAFFSLKAAIETMKGGSLVYVGSVAARFGLPGHEAIAAAKGGVESLVRSAAATYASRGFRINAVSPAMVDTPLAAPIISSEQARKASEKMHPLGTIGKPEQVASLMAWLCSNEASWMTGEVIAFDGGMGTIKGRG